MLRFWLGAAMEFWRFPQCRAAIDCNRMQPAANHRHFSGVWSRFARRAFGSLPSKDGCHAGFLALGWSVSLAKYYEKVYRSNRVGLPGRGCSRGELGAVAGAVFQRVEPGEKSADRVF